MPRDPSLTLGVTGKEETPRLALRGDKIEKRSGRQKKGVRGDMKGGVRGNMKGVSGRHTERLGVGLKKEMPRYARQDMGAGMPRYCSEGQSRAEGKINNYIFITIVLSK